MSTMPYVEAIENLMYAMLCTRPDICFEVGMLSCYQSNPRPTHWAIVKRIFRYLQGTTEFALCFCRGDLRLKGYSDADWTGDRDERKSTELCIHSWRCLGEARSRPVLPYLRWSLSIWHVHQLCKKLSG